MVLLEKFDRGLPTTKESLARALTGEELPQSAPVAAEIDLDGLVSFIESLDPDLSGTQLDSAMVQPVHQELRDLSRRDAAQPEVWQWLCIVKFRELPWRRWLRKDFPRTDDSLRHYLLEDPSPGGLPGRYLGNANIGSLARNTFARLWWVAEVLEGDYDLARKAVSNAQLFVDVFERRLGLNPQIASVCVEVLGDADDDTVKKTVRRLQQRAKTTRLESLPKESLLELTRGLAS